MQLPLGKHIEPSGQHFINTHPTISQQHQLCFIGLSRMERGEERGEEERGGKGGRGERRGAKRREERRGEEVITKHI